MPTRGHLLNMDNFIDSSSAEGRFDYSEWVRAYGRYLDEQLEVYAKINYYQVRRSGNNMFGSYCVRKQHFSTLCRPGSALTLEVPLLAVQFAAKATLGSGTTVTCS